MTSSLGAALDWWPGTGAGIVVAARARWHFTPRLGTYDARAAPAIPAPVLAPSSVQISRRPGGVFNRPGEPTVVATAACRHSKPDPAPRLVVATNALAS
jgi:hypothetical protein